MDIRARVIAACYMHAVYEYRAHHDRKHIVAAHSENSRLRELLRFCIESASGRRNKFLVAVQDQAKQALRQLPLQ